MFFRGSFYGCKCESVEVLRGIVVYSFVSFWERKISFQKVTKLFSWFTLFYKFVGSQTFILEFVSFFSEQISTVLWVSSGSSNVSHFFSNENTNFLLRLLKKFCESFQSFVGVQKLSKHIPVCELRGTVWVWLGRSTYPKK